MQNEHTFSFTYRAPDNREVREIRNKYLPLEKSNPEKPKRLSLTKRKHFLKIFETTVRYDAPSK